MSAKKRTIQSFGHTAKMGPWGVFMWLFWNIKLTCHHFASLYCWATSPEDGFYCALFMAKFMGTSIACLALFLYFPNLCLLLGHQSSKQTVPVIQRQSNNFLIHWHPLEIWSFFFSFRSFLFFFALWYTLHYKTPCCKTDLYVSVLLPHKEVFLGKIAPDTRPHPNKRPCTS